MAGRFEGLNDIERKLSEDIFPDKEGGSRGMPAARPRKILNPPLFILTTGSRWRGLPRGPRRASKSSSRRRLKSWHTDGTLQELKAGIPGAAETRGMICRDS